MALRTTGPSLSEQDCKFRRPLSMSSTERLKDFFNEQVVEWRAFYSPLAPRTLTAQCLISRQRFALQMVEASVPHGSKILDVGCGTGEMAAELMRRGYDVWGLDIAEARIRSVHERFGADRFRVGDIEHIEFPDNTFDAVVCLGVMEYLDRDEPALQEVWRVLKPGGKAVISTLSAICPFHYMDRVLVVLVRPLYRFVKYRMHGRQLPGPEPRSRKYFRGRWLRLLRSVRLEPEDWLCHCWGCYTLPRFFGQAYLGRASDWFARNRALNWLGSHQLVRVRAVK